MRVSKPFELVGLLFVFVALISYVVSARDQPAQQPQTEKAVDLNGLSGYNQPHAQEVESAVNIHGYGDGYGGGGYGGGHGGYGGGWCGPYGKRCRGWPPQEEALYYGGGRGGYGGGYGGRGGYGGGYGGRGGYGGGYGGRGGYGGGYGGRGRHWPPEDQTNFNIDGSGNPKAFAGNNQVRPDEKGSAAATTTAATNVDKNVNVNSHHGVGKGSQHPPKEATTANHGR